MAGKRAPTRKGGRKPFVRATKDLYQEVTDSIVAQLESGELPWGGTNVKWQATGPTAPYNAVSGRSYRGWNLLHLMAVARRMSEDTFDPRFCSFKQAKEKGWNVKKGAKSVPVFFYKQVVIRGSGNRPDDEAGKAMALVRNMHGKGGATVNDEASMDRAEGQIAGKKVWLLKAFPVFHASQVEGIPPLVPADAAWEPNELAYKMVEGLRGQGMAFVEGGDVAGYLPVSDRMLMPHEAAFESVTDYAHVLMHECGHATGHASRLNRPDLGQDRDSDGYVREELVAEMTSAMLCAQIGITQDYTEHALYLRKWLDVLKSDKKFLMRAAGQAANAADYLIDLVPDLRASLAASRKASADLDETVDLDGLFGEGDEMPSDVPVMEVSGGDFEPEQGEPVMGDDEAGIDLSDMLADMGVSAGGEFEGEGGNADADDTSVPEPEMSDDDPRQAAVAVDASDWFDEFVEDAPAVTSEIEVAQTVSAARSTGGLFKKRPVVSM